MKVITPLNRKQTELKWSMTPLKIIYLYYRGHQRFKKIQLMKLNEKKFEM